MFSKTVPYRIIKQRIYFYVSILFSYISLSQEKSIRNFFQLVELKVCLFVIVTRNKALQKISFLQGFTLAYITC